MFRTGCEVRRGKSVHLRVNQTILRSRSAQNPRTRMLVIFVCFLLMMVMMVIISIIIVLLQLIIVNCNIGLVENQERDMSLIRRTRVRI